jgi:hypothetical protein
MAIREQCRLRGGPCCGLCPMLCPSSCCCCFRCLALLLFAAPALLSVCIYSYKPPRFSLLARENTGAIRRAAHIISHISHDAEQLAAFFLLLTAWRLWL